MHCIEGNIMVHCAQTNKQKANKQTNCINDNSYLRQNILYCNRHAATHTHTHVHFFMAFIIWDKVLSCCGFKCAKDLHWHTLICGEWTLSKSKTVHDGILLSDLFHSAPTGMSMPFVYISKHEAVINQIVTSCLSTWYCQRLPLTHEEWMNL